MPSAEELVSGLDNFDQPPPATTEPAAKLEAAAQDTEDAWGFSASPKKETSKKKKKGKKHARVQQTTLDDGVDSSAYPKSITPSPPAEHVRRPAVASHSPSPQSPAVDVPSLVNLRDETHTVVGPPAPPTGSNTKLSPQLSPPPVRSPGLMAASPVSIAAPSSRPVPLHGVQDRRNSHSSFNLVMAPKQTRRESFLTQPSPRPRFVEAPLPHMPQAHFFQLPDLDIGSGQKQDAGKPAGSDGYCLTLDSLADAGSEISAEQSRDALIVGCDGGLEVLRILPNKLEIVGRLEGLRGAVLGAKIVPYHHERYDLVQACRPLIVVISHGPMLEHDSGPEGDGTEHIGNDTITHYQTAVDVYSLQTQSHVAQLYASPSVAIDQPTLGHIASLPEAVGDLEVDARGRFITVSSGKSGEVFVFTDTPNGIFKAPQFRCIGKFWTSIQRPPPARSASVSDALAATDASEHPRRAICSLSSRWLTIVAPSGSSSNISLAGAPLIADTNGSPPGVSTHAASPQPAITCEVVDTGVEGAWSRLGRQAAQGFVKVSQRGFEMGRQGWKELTQPSPPSTRLSQEHGSYKDVFPPTKAPTDGLRSTQEPELVCLIDLENLLSWESQKLKYLPSPLATFALLDGCNFVSMSSGGTKLLTSTRNGEVSVVWDLAQVARGIPKRSGNNDLEGSTCPSVKQLLRITRNSPSTVLKCAWSKDDDSLALLTAHGTIHLHEVPAGPSARKRKWATSKHSSVAEKADATISLSTGLSPPSSGFLGSIKSWSQTVSTQVNSMRSTNPASAFGLPTTFAGFREATTAAGNAGSRAVARGLSQGLTAAKGASSDYWHADDNKIRHTKALQQPRSHSSLRWLRRNNTNSVVVACIGAVHVHPVQRVTRRRGHEVVSGLRHERYAHKAFPLPPIATGCDEAGLKGPASCAGQGPHGFWSLRDSPSQVPNARRSSSATVRAGPILGNDVETNPPFCPFHVGEQVGIYALDELGSSQYREPDSLEDFRTQGHGIEDQAAWTFGEALPKTSKINDHVADTFRESAYFDGDGEDGEGGEEDVVESKLTIAPARNGKKHDEHIRVNTRRKQGGKPKGVAAGYDAEVEFFEDDEGLL